MGFSQRAFQGQLHFGMVTSQMSGDGLGGWDKFGLNGGALVRTPLSKNSALRAGFIYVEKGSKTKLDTITYNSFAYRLRYLDFPILIDWQWKRFRYSIGPCIGLLIKQDILSNDNVYPTAPAFLKYELAGQLGIGFELTHKWVAEMKFSSSILPVRPSPNFANQYSFYEKGNYNQCIHFALIRTLGE
jgi:Outer membrane protein beta-barrel domain